MILRQLLVLAVLMLLAPPARTQERPELVYIPGVELAYKSTSSKGLVYLADRPSIPSFAEIRSLGVHTVINLRNEGEIPVDFKKLIRRQHMNYKNIPISETTFEWRQIKKAIYALSRAKSHPVLIFAGDFDVVLMVMAIKWIEVDDMPVEDAIKLLKRLGITDRRHVNTIRSFITY